MGLGEQTTPGTELVSWTGCLSFTLTRRLLPTAQVQRAKLPMGPDVVGPDHHLLPLPLLPAPITFLLRAPGSCVAWILLTAGERE